MYKLAVLGSPISHSFSPTIHNVFADECNENISYIKIECDKEQLVSVVKRLVSEGYDGFNCTMPLKEKIAALANFSDDAVKTLSSANTVKVTNGKLSVFTTDGDGLCTAIERRTLDALEGKRVVVAGCGAAARSIIFTLLKRRCHVKVLNRTKYDLPYLAQAAFDPLNPDTLMSSTKDCDVFINATSLGMKDFATFPSLDFVKNMSKHAVVCDVVYKPVETELLKAAKSQILQTVDGIDMLILQGALAFEIWTGIFPPESAINKAYDAIANTIHRKGCD